MVKVHVRLIAIVCVFLGVSAQFDECPYKECYCTPLAINCANIKWTQIPTTNVTNSALTNFVLDYNLITVIPAGVLPPNLTEIDLVENPITTIEDTAFDGSSSTLEILSFTFAIFTRIPDAFHHLKKLKNLNIQDTNIQDWNEETMNYIGQTMESLDLENVSFTSWPTWIGNFSHLIYLTIARSSISSIPDHAFDKVTNTLDSLYLFSNNLTVVPKALLNLQALNYLFLQNNKITDVSWLPRASKVSTLWLNTNRISDANMLSDALSSYGGSLMSLDIHENQLTAIPNITYITQIGNLDFSHNKISNLVLGSLFANVSSVDFSYNFLSAIPSVVPRLLMANELTLSWNSIKGIRGTDLPPSVSLLELGYNLIIELTDNSFPENSKLTVLHLNMNPVSTISDLAFQHVPHLLELNLQGSKLTRLPMALKSFNGLSMFDMTGSVNLICTCEEKSLGELITSQPAYSVLGNCGQLSIYEFFSELSPDCP